MTVRRNGIRTSEGALCGVSSCAAPRESGRPPVVVDLRGELTFDAMTAAMVAGEREAARIGTRILLVSPDPASPPRGYDRSKRLHRATTAIRPSAHGRKKSTQHAAQGGGDESP